MAEKFDEERLQKIEKELFINKILLENMYLKSNIKEGEEVRKENVAASLSCIRERDAEIRRLQAENQAFRENQEQEKDYLSRMNLQYNEKNAEIHTLKQEVESKNTEIERYQATVSKLMEELAHERRTIKDQVQQMYFLKAKLNRFLDGDGNKAVHAWELSVEKEKVTILEKRVETLATRLIEQEEITKHLREELEEHNNTA